MVGWVAHGSPCNPQFAAAAVFLAFIWGLVTPALVREIEESRKRE